MAAKSKPRKKYPAIKGLSWHPREFYSFFTPIDWQQFEWPDGRMGEIYGPDPSDPLTVFAVSVDDMGMRVTAEDLDVLSEGFFETIEAFEDCQLELREQKAVGKLLELEAKYTFKDGENTRKCWTRVFYHFTRQVTMTARGATVEKYDYWLPMFFQAMATAKVHSKKPKSVF